MYDMRGPASCVLHQRNENPVFACTEKRILKTKRTLHRSLCIQLLFALFFNLRSIAKTCCQLLSYV